LKKIRTDTIRSLKYDAQRFVFVERLISSKRLKILLPRTGATGEGIRNE
jgi:hypothetical protein